MKTSQPVIVGLAILTAAAVTQAQMPQVFNYQGRVQVGTNDFNGTGQFKFALVNANGGTTYWSNDGTVSGQPAAAVTLPVTQGLYSVQLGNASLPNMQPVPPGALASGDVHLRVWFNDGVNGFQQFVPDQRLAAAAYAVNAVNAVTAGSLTGPISPEQLPPGVLRETNGTTTVAGNVVVQGTITTAGLDTNGAAGSSGLPAGSTLEVLINNVVVPGIRFEGLKTQFGGDELRLSRSSTDLSWPGVFSPGPAAPWTNPPVAIRLSLPNGGQIIWTVMGSEPADLTSSYGYQFSHPIGRDGKPFDRVVLRIIGNIIRSDINVSAVGSLPVLPFHGPVSGHPQSSALRLIVDGMNYNNVAVQGEIRPKIDSPLPVVLNPTFHRALSQWALNGRTSRRGVELLLVNGLAGTVSLADAPYDGSPKDGGPGATIVSYELRLAADGLPYEVIAIERFSL